ncbi:MULTISPECIES: c-type cytochrome biogenesis protein CcmI [unclassified Ensifer]|uniref:c-type cytochrome biogenesis protein CcmI n=1 Tax=unclassified Ensifer TaxID=2633371 RepID=UPI0008135EC2|nr:MULTISPECIES: c-type cytochrome biogenesis protein CcmI [unclassified Ensifer]OCP00423.1 c-type cytochrome biogenesis protein CcmI [Ensifer sp. LC14]OCP01964.1 c-type cytochrome biogenesis protein CcmI [Ensifer sp. LC11]OCP02280.1 c-type cytochrome biogenesis protein CcmI [Ensifer sp. LC13]OCP29771.1 c-type cytochrome biogenesis protein CcmI [Ensifer sp. LC499]
MLFWILVAILTAAVAAVLILPLLRAGEVPSSPHSHDVEVYRDQLDELKRDQDSGLIGSDDAELARAEVARRLLAAGESDRNVAPAGSPRRGVNRVAQVFVLLCLPAVGLCLYLLTGSPGVPAQPLAARLADPNTDINILIAKAENHLAVKPDDGAGWDLLAPIYMRTGRVEDAVDAYDRAIRLLGPTPARLGGYAEALVVQSDGLVTTKAQEALRQALSLDPNDPRSEFYLALGLKQEGKKAEALTAFNRLAATSPADAPWLPLVKQHVAELTGGGAGSGAAPGNPSAEDVAAADSMSAGDRQEMIRGMVESLESRLKENPDNLEGWARLIRSHVVLDQRDKAAAALKEGLKAFPANGDGGKQLLALAHELGIATDGVTQ